MRTNTGGRPQLEGVRVYCPGRRDKRGRRVQKSRKKGREQTLVQT